MFLFFLGIDIYKSDFFKNDLSGNAFLCLLVFVQKSILLDRKIITLPSFLFPLHGNIFFFLSLNFQLLCVFGCDVSLLLAEDIDVLYVWVLFAFCPFHHPMYFAWII